MAEKIALVGIGKIARDQHIPAIHGAKEWELAAVVSRSTALDGVDTYPTIEALLAARPDISTLSLAMPPQPRFDVAVKALNAGRHVMLEKPPAHSLAACLQLQRLATEKGVGLFASWHSRFAWCVPAARAWLEDKTLVSLRIAWNEDVRRWHPGQHWIFEPGGMGVFDPGINAVSIMTQILRDPVHVKEATLLFPKNRQAPIAATVAFHHGGGADVRADFDWRQEGPQQWTIDVETTEGHLGLTDGGSKMYVDGALVDGGPNEEYPRLYRRLSELVAAGRSDMDLSPLVHVVDAFALGGRVLVEPFHF